MTEQTSHSKSMPCAAEADDTIDPAAPFYAMFIALNADGRLEEADIGDGNQIAREIEPLEAAAADCAEDGCTAYIYRVVPIRKYEPITRYRIEELGKPPKSALSKARALPSQENPRD